eukprot:scaffold651458_cov41-Prasinocladus_malaysianus.AAC.1
MPPVRLPLPPADRAVVGMAGIRMLATNTTRSWASCWTSEQPDRPLLQACLVLIQLSLARNQGTLAY